MKTRLLPFLLFVTIVLSSCTKSVTGPVFLQGNVTGDPGEVIIVSFLPGQSIEYHYPEVKNGVFEFSLDGVENFTDLTVSVGGVEFGAHINVNETLIMDFIVNEYAEDVKVSYSANEKEGLFWGDFYETYQRWSIYNLVPDRDPNMTFDESLALLENNDRLFRTEHKSELDNYYTHRVDLAYSLLKAILIEQKTYEEDTDPFQLPEYMELLDIVDLNDPDEVTFPLFFRWMNYVKRELGDISITQNIGFLKQYGGKITNPAIKEMIANNMASDLLFRIDINNLAAYEPLFAEIDNFVPEHPEIIENCRAKIEATLKSQPGLPVPEASLEAPAGNHILLSSLFGKVLYIDVWATWCGPCVKEGPYFKALAEKYRNDDRICFISISTDDTAAPWIDFLNKEQPFWPQYRFDDSFTPDFCRTVGINSIPRFMLIGADGHFIDADAPRPSNEKIESIIESAIKK